MGNICNTVLDDTVLVRAVASRRHRDWYHMKDWFVEDDSSSDDEDDEKQRHTYKPPPFQQIVYVKQ